MKWTIEPPPSLGSKKFKFTCFGTQVVDTKHTLFYYHLEECFRQIQVYNSCTYLLQLTNLINMTLVTFNNYNCVYTLFIKEKKSKRELKVFNSLCKPPLKKENKI